MRIIVSTQVAYVVVLGEDALHLLGVQVSATRSARIPSRHAISSGMLPV
jgi:hypothetical protein